MEQKIFSDKDKITEILKIFKLNIKDFAKKIGVEKQKIYDITGGNTLYISREIMQGIAYNCPEISLFWLITGDGQPTKNVSGHHNAVTFGTQSPATVNDTEQLTAIIRQQSAQIDKLINLLATK